VTDPTFGDVAREFGWLLVYAAPLGLSILALIDAARWDSWVWAMAGRRRVLWMAVIAFGVLSVPLGIAISAFYLLWVRRHLRSVESGNIELPDPPQ